MLQYSTIQNVVSLIPYGKVITYKMLADIFCTTPVVIKKLLQKDIHNVVPSSGLCVGGSKQKRYLLKTGIEIVNNKVTSGYFRKPIMTNYYVSLITRDKQAIEVFANVTKKIGLLHPGNIIKTPLQYHITLADCSSVKINKTLIENVFKETEGLMPFYFHCILQKPYIDTKKQKVIFWIRLQNNPFLLTLHQCLKKHISRRATRSYIPHITLGKLLKQTTYNKKFEDIVVDTMCTFDTICITANIDNNKDIVLFSHKLM